MKSAAIISLIPAAAAFCHHGTDLYKRQLLSGRAPGKAFGFDALDGPLNWHYLTAANMACAVGKNQSPINVQESNTKQVQGSTITFSPEAQSYGATLENMKGFLEVRANGTMKNGGLTYSLKQFHFHTPSEHRINGEHFPLEVHFVWEAQVKNSSSLAVVGFPIEVSETSDPLLASVFRNIDQVAAVGSRASTGPLDYTTLVDHLSKNTIYQYSGSLTTPPCAEAIAWNVVGTPIPIDIKTYLKAKSIMKYNARYTQNSPGEINLLEHTYKTLKEVFDDIEDSEGDHEGDSEGDDKEDDKRDYKKDSKGDDKGDDKRDDEGESY
ncbi:Carbonic anhydrase [Colletotrichum tanaceti]|uniref:Carbonic anhydrase n=1 Tax=Colletotrichum tanaceti TaxID=1306861 RepID=A0A4U6XHX0_9PEZI|nr:Carbonic anhydrase [Colletotrichum tanaceti]TKW55123.1 Carbonic anhydrase [Colletotrichum tanaceti]